MYSLTSRVKRWHVLFAVLACALVSLVAPASAHASGVMLAFALTGTTQITDADSALKILADGTVVRNIVTDSETLDMFEQDTNVKVDTTTGGRYIETAQTFRLGGAYGARVDGEFIPVPGIGLVKNSKTYLKKSIGVVEMSGDVMRRAKGDPGAYVDWAAQELPNLVERARNVDDRTMLGFGAGCLARVNVVGTAGATTVNGIAGTTLTLKDAHGIAGLGNAWLNFLEGDSIVFSATLAATALRNAGAGQAAHVLKVDQDNGAIVVDAVPTGAVANDYIFLGDALGASTLQADGTEREFMGLMGLIDGGSAPILTTFQGVLRSDFVQWNSVIVDGSLDYTGGTGTTGILNEDVLQYAYDETGVRGGGRVDTILTALSGQRAFWKELRKDRMLLDPSKNKGYVGGGFKNGKGIPMLVGDQMLAVRASRKCPPQITFGITTSTIVRHQLDEFEWDNTTGSRWKQVVATGGYKDAFFAYGYTYKQFSNSAPRKSFKITGLTASL